MSGRGLLLVLSGPSGVGKSTVAERLLADARFGRAVTATTRAPRPGETDGVHYHFLSDDEFVRGIGSGRFLEHALVYGRRYGTPVESVRRVLDAGKVCVLVIDVQGAESVSRMRDAGGLGMDVLTVFLAAPGEEELLRRLAGRGTETEADVRRRFEAARSEEDRAGAFDRRVVNDDLDRAAREIMVMVSARGDRSGS